MMRLRDKKIIITGGAGFIGSHLARSFCTGNDVVVIDDLSTGRLENISDVANDVRFIKGDINDIELLREEFESADYVLHHAALASVERSVADPIFANHSNVDGTLSVLVAARDCGIKRVVYASSSAVYGDVPEQPKKEYSLLKPLSPYAVTKLVGEYYCKVFCDLYGLETVSLRYFNVFGPGQNPDSTYAAVIPKFVKALEMDKRPVIYGDGEQSRDFVYVDDVVMANAQACISSGAGGKVINIGSGRKTSLNQLVGVLKDLIGVEIEPVYAGPRAGDVRDSLADIRRAKELLGYEPRYDLREGLRGMVDMDR